MPTFKTTFLSLGLKIRGLQLAIPGGQGWLQILRFHRSVSGVSGVDGGTYLPRRVVQKEDDVGEYGEEDIDH